MIRGVEEMPDYVPAVDDAELYRDLICRIDGVLYAQCNMDANGQPEEIHVISDMSRAPKQLVRDIQSAMAARFQIKLDHRIISIAQIHMEKEVEDDKNRPAAIAVPLRLAYNELSLTTKPSSVCARVTLSGEDKEGVGSSHSGNTPRGKLYAVAQATLDAIHHYYAVEERYRLVDVRQGEIGSVSSVSVLVEADADMAGSRLLLGSAIDREDLHGAVVRATLDALNRSLAKL